MANNDASWFSRMLSAFSSLFGAAEKTQQKRSPIQNDSKTRHIAGHWPVHVELSASTREAHKPRDDSAFTLRFSASDAALLRSLRIHSKEFNGSHVPDKKAFVVQVPERLVQELLRNPNDPAYIEGFMDGEPLGTRRFTIPLTF
jgi:hypothetical protein